MNILIILSKDRFKEINNISEVKESISNAVNDMLSRKRMLSGNDVHCYIKKIPQDGIDIYMVLDFFLSPDDKKNNQYMEHLRLKMDEIMKRDQRSFFGYKIRMKVDEKYTQNDSLIRQVMEAPLSNDEKKQTTMHESYVKRSESFVPVDPEYSFERVILPQKVKDKIEHSLNILKYENKVFKEWGLYEIQPHPSSCLSFFGPSGTGKTMAAEAIAHKLGKKILKVSYADVESKYHGEGPKHVKAIFLAAERTDSVLFFDEADSLLSKRLTNVNQGSEQAINSMRSQLLVCLEEFKGIVVFATNLVVNYDKAFLTRLISIEFTLPDVDTRKEIWDVHIRPISDGKPHKLNIPLNDDVDTNQLAEKYEFVGREIRNAVVSACVSAAMRGSEDVRQEDFIAACDKIIEEKNSIANANDYTESKQNDNIKMKLLEKLSEDNKDNK